MHVTGACYRKHHPWWSCVFFSRPFGDGDHCKIEKALCVCSCRTCPVHAHTASTSHLSLLGGLQRAVCLCTKKLNYHIPEFRGWKQYCSLLLEELHGGGVKSHCVPLTESTHTLCKYGDTWKCTIRYIPILGLFIILPQAVSPRNTTICLSYLVYL